MNLTWQKRRLELNHPWTLSRGTSEYKEYWFVELEDDGFTGHGEAAHNIRYGESLDSVEAHFEKIVCDPALECEGPAAGKAALDIARHDLEAKRRGQTVHEMLGVEHVELRPTSYSIGIDSQEVVEAKIAEAADFEVLKIKLGGGNDEEVLRALRKVTDKVVWVDANEGWRDREMAIRKIEWLANLDIELVEQPMPAGNFEDGAWLKERSPLPLIADEDACDADSVADLAAVYHGINVKLMKAGGIEPALEMIRAARSQDLEVMLGCMIESSLGVAAAVQLAPLADYLDLDGHLILADDPFTGLECIDGKLVMPRGPGLGVEPRFRF